MKGNASDVLICDSDNQVNRPHISSHNFLFQQQTVKVTQSCSTLCNPTDYTAHGILQARILGWVAFPFSRGPPQLRDQTQVSCIAGRFFTSWATSIATLVIGVSFCFSAPITCRCSLLVVFTQNLFFNLFVYMTQFM